MGKRTTIDYSFSQLRNITSNYAGMTFETVSGVRHRHLDFYELIYITKGEWGHTSEQITTIFPAGTLILLPPESTHQLFTEPLKSEHFVLCIKTHYFERTIRSWFPSFSFSAPENFLSVSVSKEKLRYIEYLGKMINKPFSSPSCIADELFFLSLSELRNHDNVLECNTYVNEIIQKINNQIYMNTSVDDICAMYPYSHSMLLSQFKTLTGMTIVQYKAQQKFKYACQLLTETDTSISAIADALQYDSLSYFLSAFKKQYHMTPSEYRNRFCNQK